MTWLASSELAGLPGMPSSQRSVLRRAQSENWQGRPRGGRGRSGLEYHVSSLPPETQQALAVNAAGAIKPTAIALQASQAVKRQQQTQACASAMARYGVQLESAGGFDPLKNPRLDLFQRFETYHRARGCAVWPAIQEFCLLWDAGKIDAHQATREVYAKLPAKTLDKWYRAWRTVGVEALLERKPRKDKGQTTLVNDSAMYEVFIAALAEMHDPTARQVRRVISNQLGEERTPPIRTLRRWLQDFKDTNKVALLKLKNPDGWRNKYMQAFGSRSEHITRVNEEWQLDSTIADAQQKIRSEIAFNLVDGDSGEIRRHALIAVIDVFTRRAQVLVSRTSSSNAVKAVTRTAMMAWGMPTRVKTDNGKDYTAQDYDFAIKEALKIEHLLCTPFSPDQKPFIERFLGTLLHDLFPMLQGFVGHDVAMRKAIDSAKSFAERFGDKGVDLRMTPEHLQLAINGWLDEYHGRMHSELGCSPDQMAERHTTHVVRIDERALDLFLMPVSESGVRTVGKRGIKIDNAWYRAPELAGVDVMGTEVYCRQSDSDIGALYVFRMDGEYVCRALDHARLGINRSELAAKAREIEKTTIKPLVDAMRKAGRKGLANKAVNAIYAEREARAVDASDNVTRLQPRVVMETTPAVDSVIAAAGMATVQDDARLAARAALQAHEEAPVLHLLDSPRQRYSAWVRLKARTDAGEQISGRDAQFLQSYEGSKEFEAWDSMQEGLDPLAEQAGG